MYLQTGTSNVLDGCLEHHECWDKQFVDDVQNSVVGHNVYTNEVSTVDLDALPY